MHTAGSLLPCLFSWPALCSCLLYCSYTLRKGLQCQAWWTASGCTSVRRTAVLGTTNCTVVAMLVLSLILQVPFVLGEFRAVLLHRVDHHSSTVYTLCVCGIIVVVKRNYCAFPLLPLPPFLQGHPGSPLTLSPAPSSSCSLWAPLRSPSEPKW